MAGGYLTWDVQGKAARKQRQNPKNVLSPCYMSPKCPFSAEASLGKSSVTCNQES